MSLESKYSVGDLVISRLGGTNAQYVLKLSLYRFPHQWIEPSPKRSINLTDSLATFTQRAGKPFVLSFEFGSTKKKWNVPST